jgi:hypothetical protein
MLHQRVKPRKIPAVGRHDQINTEATEDLRAIGDLLIGAALATTGKEAALDATCELPVDPRDWRGR